MRKTPVLMACAFGAWLQVPLLAHGQSAPAAPSASALPSEPNERAKREASNPMRLILEAGKIKRKGADAEPVAATAAAPATAPVITPRVVAPAPAPTPAPAAPAPAPQRRVVAEVAVPLAAVPQPEPVPVPVPVPTRALESLPSAPVPFAAMPISANTPLADAGAAAAPMAPILLSPLPAPPQEPPANAAQTAPRLLSQVAPEFPENLMRRVRSFTELLVQITVNIDGSVRDISIVTPGYRVLEPYVIDALTQWRYKPQEQARTQQLRLVFNDQR